jgi:hypothetical protein
MSPIAEGDAAPQQLITYTFPPGSDFGGMLMGALQRIESGGAIRILDVVFLARDADSGELTAVARHNDTSVGMIGELISFRLDPAARTKETDAALGGPLRDLVRALAEPLEPGWAFAGVLVEHSWAQVLGDAVAQIGGSPLTSELLAPASTERAWAELPTRLERLGA